MAIPNPYTPYVVWALNDHLTRPGMVRRLRALRNSGFGGVMIQPWGGTPYRFMSASWVERIAWAVEIAKREGLGVWLWDDWLFPSGFAGGVLGKQDRHKSKRIVVMADVTVEVGETVTLSPPPRSLSAAVVKSDKYNNPFGRFNTIELPKDGIIRHTAKNRSRIVIVGWEMVSSMRHTVRSHSLYLKGDPRSDVFTCDDSSAWSCDMLCAETTRSFLGLIHEKYFQRLQPHFGKTLHGFFFDEPHLPSMYPWTFDLADDFLRRKGYDLLPFLVPLFMRRTNLGYDHHAHPSLLIADKKLKSVLSDYHDVWTSMLSENFYGVIQKWCKERNVLSAGHMGSDENFKTIFSSGGVSFKNMDKVDVPGVDVIWGQVAPGRFDDFPRLIGSRASINGLPFAISESFAVQGHGTHIDEMRYLMDHQLIRGINHFLVEVASYNPKKSFFFHPPEVNPAINLMIRHFGTFLHKRTAHVSKLLSLGKAPSKCCLFISTQDYFQGKSSQIAERVLKIARELTYSQREFEYAWNDDLTRMSVRDELTISRGGQVFSEIVIVGNCDCESAKMIKTLKRQGAQISVFCESERALLKTASRIDVNILSVKSLGKNALPVAFPETGKPVSIRSRIFDDGNWVIFLLNESTEPQTLPYFCKPGWALAHEPLDGTDFNGDVIGEDSLHFMPMESKMIRVTTSARAINHRKNLSILSFPLTDWKLKLPNNNMIRLPKKLPSWHDLGFGTFTGFLSYYTRFSWEGGDAVLDLGDLRYAAKVWLDGTESGSILFTPYQMRFKHLKKGWHELRIDVLNTLANTVCGTKERETDLERAGAFVGTYAPFYLPLDREKICSGLLGPVIISQTVVEHLHLSLAKQTGTARISEISGLSCPATDGSTREIT